LSQLSQEANVSHRNWPTHAWRDCLPGTLRSSRGSIVLISIALPVILTIIMFSLGLGLTLGDFARVYREPRGFWIGALNQLVLLPSVAFFAATAFGLPPELGVGIMIIGVCPGSALSNVASKFARGNVPLSVSLTAVFTLVSIVTVPPFVAFAVHYFTGASSPPVEVTNLGIRMFLLTAVPVGLGMALARAMPSYIGLIKTWMGRLAVGLFIFVLLAALTQNWRLFAANIPALAPALVTMNALQLGIGLLSSRLARLNMSDATTVAIGTAIHNGTVGIAVGAMVAGSTSGFPPTTLPTAIYSISVWLMTIPFMLWRRSVGSTSVW